MILNFKTSKTMEPKQISMMDVFNNPDNYQFRDGGSLEVGYQLIIDKSGCTEEQKVRVTKREGDFECNFTVYYKYPSGAIYPITVGENGKFLPSRTPSNNKQESEFDVIRLQY